MRRALRGRRRARASRSRASGTRTRSASDGTPSEFLAAFRTYYGPTMNAFAAAAADGREPTLHAELEALFNEQNASGSAGTTSIPATFLRVTVTV